MQRNFKPLININSTFRPNLNEIKVGVSSNFPSYNISTDILANYLFENNKKIPEVTNKIVINK